LTPTPIPITFPYTTLFRSASISRLYFALRLPLLPRRPIHRKEISGPRIPAGPVHSADQLESRGVDKAPTRIEHHIFVDVGMYDPDRKSTRLNSSHVKISYA